MNNQNSNTNTRLIFGLILIVLGGLFLLDNYGIIYFSLPDFFWHWEYILISIGIILLVTSGNKTAGTILIGIGLFNLFPELWPLLLVGLGIYIIMKRSTSVNKNIKVDTSEEGSASNLSQVVDDVSIFGGGTKSFISSNFKGGKLTAIFGGADIHLEKCSLSKGSNILDLFVMFGGYTIYVPKDWNIIIDIVPIFGGFSDNRFKDPDRVYEEDKNLVIKGLVLFGGGEIKS